MSHSQHSPGNKRLLIVGYRKPIIDVLIRLKLPFAIWHDRPIKGRKSIAQHQDCLKICEGGQRGQRAFPKNATEIRAFVEREFAQYAPFTDVIAGTEAAVYAASVCRRSLGARKSKDSIALRCSDKQPMKALMKKQGIPMTDYLTRAESESLEDVFQRLGPIVVVKQRRNSGGRGVSIARSASELAERKEAGLLYEKFIDAHELSIESFIENGKIRFSSATNYLVKTHANIVPANVPKAVLQTAHELNRRAVEALKLKWGMTHAEFYWNKTTESATSSFDVLFGEIALRPPGGYIMECMSLAYGFDAWEAFVANEINLPVSFPEQIEKTAGVAILHAGEGQLATIENVGIVRALPSCVRFKSLVKPGDLISARAGVGEVSAYGLFANESKQQAISDIQKCLNIVKFKFVKQ